MKFQTGAFVFYRTGTTCKPMLPQAIEDLADQCAIPHSICPQYAGDRAIVTRSISTVSAGMSRTGWLVRPIKQTQAEVVYGIVKEDKDQVAERLDHRFDDTLRWSKEDGGGAWVSSTHEVGHKVND